MSPLPKSSSEAQRRYIEKVRGMTVAEKFGIMADLCRAEKSRMLTLIWVDYPDADEEEIRKRFVVRMYGPKIAKQLLNWDAEVEGH